MLLTPLLSHGSSYRQFCPGRDKIMVCGVCCAGRECRENAYAFSARSYDTSQCSLSPLLDSALHNFFLTSLISRSPPPSTHYPHRAAHRTLHLHITVCAFAAALHSCQPLVAQRVLTLSCRVSWTVVACRGENFLLILNLHAIDKSQAAHSSPPAHAIIDIVRLHADNGASYYVLVFSGSSFR